MAYAGLLKRSSLVLKRSFGSSSSQLTIPIRQNLKRRRFYLALAQHKSITMVKDMGYDTISMVLESWETANNRPDFNEKVGSLVLLK
jgi:hypothetical protein